MLAAREANLDTFFAANPNSPDRDKAYAAIAHNRDLIAQGNAVADASELDILANFGRQNLKVGAFFSGGVGIAAGLAETGIARYNGEIGDAETMLAITGAARAIAGSARLAKAAESAGARMTVFRVEGTPNARFAIDDLGNVALQPGDKTIWLNFGQESRGMSYLDRKVADGLPGAQLKSFEIDARFVDEIRSTAVPESLARRNPGAPIISRDPYPDQFGLRPDQFQKLMESVFQGTGKNVRPR